MEARHGAQELSSEALLGGEARGDRSSLQRGTSGTCSKIHAERQFNKGGDASLSVCESAGSYRFEIVGGFLASHRQHRARGRNSRSPRGFRNGSGSRFSRRFVRLHATGGVRRECRDAIESNKRVRRSRMPARIAAMGKQPRKTACPHVCPIATGVRARRGMFLAQMCATALTPRQCLPERLDGVP
jgi:hypothetical protein